MRNEIVLIGPIKAGKSTISRHTADILNLKVCKVDEIRFEYYNRIGYCKTREKEIAEKDGFPGVYRYWKPFEIYAIERILSDYSDCIFDFGGGHSVYENEAYLNRAKKLLEPYQNVVLILPSPNHEESIKILRERTTSLHNRDFLDRGFDFHQHFVTNRSNYVLAKHILYTKGKSAKESTYELLSLINNQD